MLRWLSSFFSRPKARFFASPSETILPECRVRLFAERDIDACEEIYRLNEPGRFPPDHCDIYLELLRKPAGVVVVIEADGKIRATGGIQCSSCRMSDRRLVPYGFLSYGMVHPEFHGRGFGTTLLLARIAALPEAAFNWLVFMNAVAASKSFYQRFGFYPASSKGSDTTPETYKHFSWVSEGEWEACHEILLRSGVGVDDGVFRVLTLDSIPRPKEPGADASDSKTETWSVIE